MKKHIKRFLTLWIIGMAAANIPFPIYGMVFGFLAVTLNSLALTFIWDELN